MLLQMIQNPEEKKQDILIPCELMIRGSTLLRP